MALYTGEAVRVRAQIIDPDTNAPFVVAEGDPDPTAELELWAPGRNPARDPDVRPTPDHSGSMEYRPETSDFILFVHTRGGGVEPDPTGLKWEPGKWSFRVTVEGNVFTNWEYGTFSLKA